MKTQGTVLITGATSGIGYDIAVIFAEKGYNLYLASRNQTKLDEIKTEFEAQYKISVTTQSVDLSQSNSAKTVYDETVKQNIEIGILVNNAGFGLQGEYVDMELPKVQEMLQLNITSLTDLCHYFGNPMKERKNGYILNVASAAAYQPVPYFGAYSATKSFVLSFSEAFAKEMEDYNVGVTCLSPGATKTNFFDAAGIGTKSKGIWADKLRMDSPTVAKIGVNALFAKKLSVIAGAKNNLLAFSNRFAPRKMVVSVSKMLVKNS